MATTIPVRPRYAQQQQQQQQQQQVQMQQAQPETAVDVDQYMQTVPKTKEEERVAEKGTAWELNFWVIAAVAIIIVLLLWVVYMYFIKGNTEEEKQVADAMRPHLPAPPAAPQQTHRKHPPAPEPEPGVSNEGVKAEKSDDLIARYKNKNVKPVPGEQVDSATTTAPAASAPASASAPAPAPAPAPASIPADVTEPSDNSKILEKIENNFTS